MPSPMAAGDEPHAESSTPIAGRYRLLQRIGSGGMGVVWLARDEMLGRQVAVKQVQHAWGSSDRTMAQGRERSMREARAAAALHHPNIVTVYDAIDGDNGLWIVMEYVHGRSLKDWVVQEGPLPVHRVRDIGLQLLSALQAAHAAGITHRDVKPANVMLCPGDVVRLTDFGLARMEGAEPLTETGAFVGTLGYLAPEQANGSAPGPAADLFGLGATLYFAVEGVGPFDRDGYLPMLAAYARHDIRPPRLAGALAPLLLRLLAADPARRPSAAQAAELFRAGVARNGRIPRRLLLTGGAAVAVTGTGVGAWSILQQRAAVRPPGALPAQSAAGATPAGSPSPSATPRPAGLGAPAWQVDVLDQPVLVGSVLVGVQPAGVGAVDANTGERRWQRKDQYANRVYGVGKGLVIVYRSEAESALVDPQVLDAASGAVRATFDQGWYAGAVDGRVFVELDDYNNKLSFAAFDALTKRRYWAVPVGDAWYGSAVPCAPGVICAAMGASGETADLPVWAAALDTKTGKRRWKTDLGRGNLGRDLWSDGKLVYAAVTRNGVGLSLVALDPSTGARRWSVSLDKDIEAAVNPTVTVANAVPVGGQVVAAITDTALGTQSAGLVAIRDGAVRWRSSLLNPAVAATPDGRLFAASFDSVLHELDPATGETLWSDATDGPVGALTVGATMLMASVGKRVVAYPLRSS
ncbi:MAG TPA: protein kinase [Actinoplanes sp.]|nr:protein kinase [Actinoplanes sp.]